ncbi:hypothetical protein E2C01_071479 [Portunus trituberculatus]|uniref:Uncharacterized protein n=1 Tax=Portunus trituberculatus TaxID=210409 RepID=A0A5B7HX43_PORTR|nr:hypothetical protein [Portunus trituberculatus]
MRSKKTRTTWMSARTRTTTTKNKKEEKDEPGMDAAEERSRGDVRKATRDAGRRWEGRGGCSIEVDTRGGCGEAKHGEEGMQGGKSGREGSGYYGEERGVEEGQAGREGISRE